MLGLSLVLVFGFGMLALACPGEGLLHLSGGVPETEGTLTSTTGISLPEELRFLGQVDYGAVALGAGYIARGPRHMPLAEAIALQEQAVHILCQSSVFHLNFSGNGDLALKFNAQILDLWNEYALHPARLVPIPA